MAAELQPPTSQPLAAYQNYAPIKPLLDLKSGGKKPSAYLQKALQERFTHFHRKDKEVFREIVNVGQLVSLYIDGKQFLCRNPYDGSWGILPIVGNSNDTRCALNVMNNLKQNLLGKWEGSNPDIIIRPAQNLDQCAAAAKAADAVNNYYERQFYHHWFTQQEGLMGMTFGTYIDRYRFDDQKVSMAVLQDVFEQRDATFGEGYGFCAQCEFGGTAAEFQSGQCPNCSGMEIDVEEPARQSLQTVAGQREHQVGDLTCTLLPMPSCRWNLAYRPEESDYFIYRQAIPRGAITRILGNVLIPADANSGDHGLDVLRALQKQGSALGGFSAHGNQGRSSTLEKNDEYTFDEMWLSPDNYADITLLGDEETVDGPTIPKGKLTDIFPDGLCAVGLNGMAVVLALYPEKHRDHIVSGSWFMQAQTGAGRGLADSVEIQKQFNVGNNQAMGYMSATFTPAIGYDAQLISGNKMKYIGDPHQNIPFDLTKLPEGRSLKDAIFQFQPVAMPNQFFNYFQDFLGLMFQKTSMVTDYANGEPGITGVNTTATAAEIDQSNADAINQPIFMIKADARRRGAELTIQLFRKHFPMKRSIALTGKYGEQQSIELSGADLKGDLIFEVARNSEMPKGPFTRQKNLMQFFSVIGGGEGYSLLRSSNPQLAAEIEQIFDVDLSTDNYDAVAELCRKRMDQMNTAARGGIDDPLALIDAIQPPISAVELELKEKAQWFAAWLSQDEGQNAPMSLRAAAEMLAKGQITGAVQQATMLAAGEGLTQAAMMAPAALGEAQLAQQPESTAPDQTAVLQAEQEAAAYAAEADEAAKDRAHELEMIEAEGRRDMKVSSHDAQQKIKIERAKPKVKPAAKSGGKK